MNGNTIGKNGNDFDFAEPFGTTYIGKGYAIGYIGGQSAGLGHMVEGGQKLRLFEIGNCRYNVIERCALGMKQRLDVLKHATSLPFNITNVNNFTMIVDAGCARNIGGGPAVVGNRHATRK